MKFIKKVAKTIGFVLIITLASLGLGIQAAILPTFNQKERAKTNIEMVEKKEDEEDEDENYFKK